ncbi:MAG: SMI1/KNR4 family protein [Planctomycetaceae bacterium]|jgi:hypothetical protein|nr:hypothetical protein [Planctomycetaceae bacterium]MDC0307726.1 hypothetical protein [Planctomycetaceae bacterium]MDG2389290.1 SMI1/KNR4 family protein [Planctomycetaceae bacterium]
MERVFPELLTRLHAIKIGSADGVGIDFEPFDEFYSKEETSEWIKAWTGNLSLDGNEYLIFGQDGSGGYAAFWCVRDSKDLLEQPIVFFGSEGKTVVVAQNFEDYVWLFANGIGPFETVAYPDLEPRQNQEFLRFAKEFAPKNAFSAIEIIKRAKSKFPNFEQTIAQLCHRFQAQPDKCLHHLKLPKSFALKTTAT